MIWKITTLGSNSITKCEVAKTKFWESLTFMFFTAMLITYIKGGTPAQIERGSAMTRATFVIFVIFFTEVSKFYWLMLIYPGELYRLLGASSYIDS